MTKADLVEEIAAQTGISRNQTAVIVDQLLDAMSRALSEGRHLEIRGFGTFKVRERRARRHGTRAAAARSWCQRSSCRCSNRARNSRPWCWERSPKSPSPY
jgi:nucleoid DNA-binding protein